jgi:hypothetical protein
LSRTGPESIFEAEQQLHADPAGTLALMRRLGVDIVRVYVAWNAVAPDSGSRQRPAFDAVNPSAYPEANWSIYDTIVREARAHGVRVDLTLGAPPPLWAASRGAPRGAPDQGAEWKPSAAAYAAFVRAVGTRYSGQYTPPGASSPLPRVDFWSIWNEPNYGPDLAPQAVDHSTVEVSPRLYRKLVDAAWTALTATGHGTATDDTILIGELAPRGITVGDNPGNFSGMVPLRFLRALYCVDASYHPLRGTAATLRGCPPDAAGSAAFPRQHPALFHATGLADHPYPQGVPPNVATPDEPDYADLATMPRLEQTLDTLQRVYGSSTRFAIYDTEFGYQTNPPETILRAISPAVAAYYLNWAEYIHYKDPRIRSYDQYLLTDPPGGGFATGLESADGKPKETFYAFRMPLFLPSTTTSAATPLAVWGCVRPADIAAQQTGKVQRVELEFQAGARGPFKTVRTVALSDPHGYFDVRQAFGQSGALRTRWRYPNGETIFSRSVTVTVR